MSSIIPARPDRSTPETDRFFYGWRYVNRTRPDGTVETEQVPLTAEDVLHPQEDDFIMQNSADDRDCRYLSDVLTDRLKDNPRALVLHDCRVAWDAEGEYAHGPDIAVFLDVDRPQRKFATFNTVQEHCLPALIIEVVSESTRQTVLTAKMREYDEVGVPLYVIADDSGDEPRALTLIGYWRGAAGYERFSANELGRLWLAPVGLWLGIVGERLALFDGVTGAELGDFSAEVAGRRAAQDEARREAEARRIAEERAAAAEERLRLLEEELRRRNGEP
jgi:Uma2 family endonuclease